MEQALHLPYMQPSAAVLARIRQFARAYRPQDIHPTPSVQPS